MKLTLSPHNFIPKKKKNDISIILWWLSIANGVFVFLYSHSFPHKAWKSVVVYSENIPKMQCLQFLLSFVMCLGDVRTYSSVVV